MLSAVGWMTIYKLRVRSIQQRSEQLAIPAAAPPPPASSLRFALPISR
jgi:hypothetical protein